MIIFCIISTIIFFGFGIIWKTNDAINSLIKVILIGMSIFGLILSLVHYGIFTIEIH